MSQFLANLEKNDSICALATGGGTSAIAIIRVSGQQCHDLIRKIFKPARRTMNLNSLDGYSLLYGSIFDGEQLLDDVMLSVFTNPNSYTGEDSFEIACHGSVYIQRKIIELLIANKVRYAEAGEFTMRAFKNGKFDLAQAEAVADLIASTSPYSHKMAMNQMRGGYSSLIKELRQQLLNFSSLLELELDFSEEDVEFANRDELFKLIDKIKAETEQLIMSFESGNVIKTGIPVAIIGKPNVGKSTLLNKLLREEKALVSEIPGTTRDSIEDTVNIEGIPFRFIDTAGLRTTDDLVENMGIERTWEKIRQAKIVLMVFDIRECNPDDLRVRLNELKEGLNDLNKTFILLGNKIDEMEEMPAHFTELLDLNIIFISAKREENIESIKKSLVDSVQSLNLDDQNIVSNSRHLHALQETYESLEAVETAMENGISTDLIAIDLRNAIYAMGSITGEITNDELLGNIFGKFCIGK